NDCWNHRFIDLSSSRGTLSLKSPSRSETSLPRANSYEDLNLRLFLPCDSVARMCYIVDMAREVRLRQSGGSVSATLPKDMADRLHLEAGDRVLAVETDRGILLTPYDPETERALKVAAKAAKKYRNALRTLAK